MGRGTVVPGALAIILIFLIALSSIAFLIVQFNQYSTSTKLANVVASERNKETLQVVIGKVQGNKIVALNVTNAGPTASLIVGWVKVNPAGDPTFVSLDSPVPVQAAEAASIPITPVPSDWTVGVWTSYVNVFWAGTPPTGGSVTVPPGEPVYVAFDANLGADASGTVLVVDGVSYPRSDLPKAFRWISGETHSFEWKSPVSGSTGVRYVWSSTSGLTTAQSGQFTVNSNGYVYATYATQYSLTINAVPSGGGTTNPAPGTYWHSPGDSVQISATANSGYAFDYWGGSGSGSYSGTASTATVTVNGPITETAYFFSFSISVSPSSGSVQQGGSVTATVTVTLTGGASQKSIGLSASGLPSGASASFSPNPVAVNPDSSTTSTMTISTSSSTPTGTYTITITGACGGLTKTATYTLTVQSAQVQVQLREFDFASSYDPDIRFSTPQAGILRLDSSSGGSSSIGRGYAFFTLPRSLLNGKKLQTRWNVYFTYPDSRDLYLGTLYVFNGVFDRRDMATYFKPNTNSEPIFNYAANILATHYPGPQGGSGWLGWRVDTSGVLDLSSWTSDYVTVMICLADNWAGQQVVVDVDYVKVLDASGNVVWTLNFDGSVTMEVTGTYNDYGLFVGS